MGGDGVGSAGVGGAGVGSSRESGTGNHLEDSFISAGKYCMYYVMQCPH